MSEVKKPRRSSIVNRQQSKLDIKIVPFEEPAAVKKGFLERHQEKKQDPLRDNIFSRETMYRFYKKDTNKLKRMETPGYVGLESMQCFYKKYKHLNKETEFGKHGYSASTAYLTQVQSMKALP